ncbi:MAG: hypothetical protein AAFP70_16070, partial [Calditrichota bacterium]
PIWEPCFLSKIFHLIYGTWTTLPYYFAQEYKLWLFLQNHLRNFIEVFFHRPHGFESMRFEDVAFRQIIAHYHYDAIWSASRMGCFSLNGFR